MVILQGFTFIVSLKVTFYRLYESLVYFNFKNSSRFSSSTAISNAS